MYSSSSLRGPMSSGCWRQLDYTESNTDSLFPLEYRSYAGQAAHAVMQHVTDARETDPVKIRAIAERVGNLLISEGHAYRGSLQPPMPADDAWEGVEIALEYLESNSIEEPEDAMVFAELDWKHPSSLFRALIDHVSIFDEVAEEYELRVAKVTDYKTSWQAGEDELNSLQRWMQAICVWRSAPVELHVIRMGIINLRTHKEFTRDLFLDSESDVAELEKWEKRIIDLCKTANKLKVGGKRPASPGIGCMTCTYRHICDEVSEPWSLSTASPEAMAAKYMIIEGQRSFLIKALKEATKESSIACGEGFVGLQEKEKKVFLDSKCQDLVEDWASASGISIPDEIKPTIASLLKALKLGAGNIGNLAKVLFSTREKGIAKVREEYVEGYTSKQRYGQFGVWK